MGVFDRLKSGLFKSSRALGGSLGAIAGRRRLDGEALEALEELLIASDIGLSASAEIIGHLSRKKIEGGLTETGIKEMLALEIAGRLAACRAEPGIGSHRPFVILMTGVNGSGKTTTVGKLARKFRDEGKTVMLAAGDTFRAAAIEQLAVWGERAGVPVVTTKPGGDAAGLAFDALQQAQAAGTDILMIDTAGRLQSNQDLMAELEKTIRVLRKIDPAAPHASLLTLDATTGQNALAQAEVFQKAAETTGLIMTKLDGTARGGVLVAIADRLKLPIHYIGVGETAEDLLVFEPERYARALVGLADIKSPGGHGIAGERDNGD